MNGKIPELRFLGCSGEWEENLLGNITDSFSGGTPSVGIAQYYNGNIPFIRSGEINSTFTELYISQEGLSNSSAKIVDKGTILYALYGATSGEVGISNINGAINQAILAIIPKENYECYFIAQWLRKEKEVIISTFLQGGQGNLSGNIVKSLEIKFPSLPEQTKIGTLFQSLDTLLTNAQQKYEKLLSLKKAMLTKMFPQKGQTVPEVRFQGFSGEWERKELGECVDVNSGCDYQHLECGDIPVFGTGGYMLSVNKALSYKKNGIGIGRKGTIDKPFLLKAPYWTVDTLFYCIPKGSNDLSFFFCNFQKIDWKQKDESTGVPSLSKVTINTTEVFITDSKEQTLIGNFFRELDKQITLQDHEIQSLKNLKQALLSKLFVS